VEDGEEAVAAVERAAYDLILMDVHMPIMTGLQAVQRIRTMPSDKARLPVIALTAHAMQGAREEYLAAGFDDYLSKPFTPAGLYAVIRRWVGASVPREPMPDPGFDEIINGLRRTFKTRLAADIVAIELLLPVIEVGAGDNWAKASGDLLSIVHRLTGTAGSLGFDEISLLGSTLANHAGPPVGAMAMTVLFERLLQACRDALA
jgi:CheY-like chemotaxis protein